MLREKVVVDCASRLAGRGRRPIGRMFLTCQSATRLFHAGERRTTLSPAQQALPDQSSRHLRKGGKMMPQLTPVNRRKLLAMLGGSIAAPYLVRARRVRARGLADAAGEIRQRFSGRRRHRYAVADHLPEDERPVRTDLRRREQGRRGRRAGGGCGGKVAAGRIHARPRRHRQQRAGDRKLRKTSLRSARRFHLHRRHVAIAQYPGGEEGSVLLGHQGIAGRVQEGAEEIHLCLGGLRHHAAFVGRDDEQHGRRGGQPHSLSWRRRRR